MAVQYPGIIPDLLTRFGLNPLDFGNYTDLLRELQALFNAAGTNPAGSGGTMDGRLDAIELALTNPAQVILSDSSAIANTTTETPFSNGGFAIAGGTPIPGRLYRMTAGGVLSTAPAVGSGVVTGAVATSLSFNTTETTLATTASLTTTGGPVVLTGWVGLAGNIAPVSAADITFNIYRDATLIRTVTTQLSGVSGASITMPLSLGTLVDTAASAGAHTWTVKALTSSVNGTVLTKASNTGAIWAWENPGKAVGPGTLKFRVRYGATIADALVLDLGTGGTTITGGLVNSGWFLDALVTVRLTGTTGSVVATGFGETDPLSSRLSNFVPGPTTVNTTLSKNLTLFAVWSVADVANTVTLRNFAVQQIN